MLTAIYRPGGDHNVWGVKAEIMHVESSEVESYLSDGWLDHPEKLFSAAEPEPEPEPEPEGNKSPKKGGKAEQNAESDEG